MAIWSPLIRFGAKLGLRGAGKTAGKVVIKGASRPLLRFGIGAGIGVGSLFGMSHLINSNGGGLGGLLELFNPFNGGISLILFGGAMLLILMFISRFRS